MSNLPTTDLRLRWGALVFRAVVASLCAGALGWLAPFLWGGFVRYGWTVQDGYFLAVTGMLAAALLFWRYRSAVIATVLGHGIAVILFLMTRIVLRWVLSAP